MSREEREKERRRALVRALEGVSAVIVDCRLDGDDERADRLTAAYTALARAWRGRPGTSAEPCDVPTLDDDETLTVTDDCGDSLTLTRAEWRRVMSSDEGHDDCEGGLYWVAYNDAIRVERIGGPVVCVDDANAAIRRWVETGVYPEDA